jgi:hypothetical protein
MTAMPAHLILKQLFDQIVDEAEKNPGFAIRLLEALPSGTIAEVKATQSRRVTPLVEIASINPVLILRKDGEAVLRTALGALTKQQLREIAKAHQLILSDQGRSKNAAKHAIIEAVTEACRFRLSERAA